MCNETPVYGWEDFAPSGARTWTARSVAQRFTPSATVAPEMFDMSYKMWYKHMQNLQEEENQNKKQLYNI